MSGCDAIVVGGGASGLAAAALLAKTGRKTELFEAREGFGGLSGDEAHAIYALDPRLLKELKLAKHGLRYAERDMPLVALRPDGRHIVIRRDLHSAAASIAILSQNDAEAWPRFRRELFELGRELRLLWWEEAELPSRLKSRLAALERTGAAAWFDSRFESDALKAALCFDATDGGLSPTEPGSALTLLWRSAQEVSGLQGAVAYPQGGPAALVRALHSAAQSFGAKLRSTTRVTRVRVADGRVAGVETETGETLLAPIVMAAVSDARLFDELLVEPVTGFAQRLSRARMSPTAEAHVILALREPPVFGGVAVPRNGRCVIAERVETHIAADLAARAGKLADEVPMEVIFPPASTAGEQTVSIRARPVPRDPAEGWSSLKEKLAAQAVLALEHLAPGVSRNVLHAHVFTPADRAGYRYDPSAITVDHMLSSYRARIETPVEGLFLCGATSEPVPSVSCRAARIAVHLATRGKA